MPILGSVLGFFAFFAMDGDQHRIEADKIKEEFTSDPMVMYFYKGGILPYMENMNGHDETVPKQFYTTWNDRHVSMNGISFEINDDIIGKATCLATRGRKWKKASKNPA